MLLCLVQYLIFPSIRKPSVLSFPQSFDYPFHEQASNSFSPLNKIIKLFTPWRFPSHHLSIKKPKLPINPRFRLLQNKPIKVASLKNSHRRIITSRWNPPGAHSSRMPRHYFDCHSGGIIVIIGHFAKQVAKHPIKRW